MSLFHLFFECHTNDRVTARWGKFMKFRFPRLIIFICLQNCFEWIFHHSDPSTQNSLAVIIETYLILLGDKVSMLTHTYQHKPLWKVKVNIYAIMIPGWQPSLCVAWCLIWRVASLEKKYGHTWHRMSLLRPGVIKQPKPKPIVEISSDEWAEILTK